MAAQKTKDRILSITSSSEKKKKHDAAVYKNKLLTAINDISIAIGRSLHLEELLNTLQEELLNLLKLKRSIIYLVKDNKLVAVTYRGFTEEYVKSVKTIKIGAGPVGKAVKQRKTMLIGDLVSTPCEISNLSKIKDTKSCLLIPLKSKEKAMGLFILFHEVPPPTIKEIKLIESISNHAGMAIENALLFMEKEKAYNELKSIQDRLVHIETLTAIGKLTAGLAHEIGTPLNIISGRAEYLLSELGEGDKRSANLKIIISQIERITNLVKRFLTLASSERDAKIENADINRVISDVLLFMERNLVKSGINVELFLGDGLPYIKADTNRLQQVFINIISNSLDATPDGGKIGIKTYLIEEKPVSFISRHSFICIEISDSGCGIEEKNLDKIFEPFFTTKKSGEGTGLGLVITRNIIKEYGGDIEVRSSVGKGATFIIRLPCLLKPHPDEPDLVN